VKIALGLRAFLAVMGLAFAGMYGQALAQNQGDGATALIITYRARPGARASFRKTMQTEGIAQLESWKKEGVFATYNALFTTYAADSVPDMFLILRFNHFTDLGRWQKIEETYPGGLTEKAQAEAAADTSGTADIISEGSNAPVTKYSQFFVLEYDVTVDTPKYVSYVQGYVAPQFEGWMKVGVLSSFVCYFNQNPAGAPWSSFIVLEYKDLKSLAAREVIKNKTRAELAIADPTWKKWSDDKSAIRKEKAAIQVLSLN
jgi:hypothetical protein